jgi:cytochrome c oxidase assembly factor CtaG
MPPLTPSSALTSWQFVPLVSGPLAVLAACYLAAVTRVRGRRGRLTARPWPGGRTAAFLAGLAVVAVATQGSVAVYDDTLLSAHMVQHLLLIMVAPPLLVFGRPVTLLLHAARNPWHTRVKRVLRSRVVTALTCPPFAVALYSAVVLGTHLTGLLTAQGALHDAEHGAYLVTGYLYFLPVIGSEPLRWRVPALGRYLLIVVAMPADIITGAVLMLHGRIGAYSAGDVRAGGLIMVAGGELIMTAIAVALAVVIVRDLDGAARRARRAQPALSGADPGADLTAYNAYLASLDRSRLR